MTLKTHLKKLKVSKKKWKEIKDHFKEHLKEYQKGEFNNSYRERWEDIDVLLIYYWARDLEAQRGGARY